jgi:hypothetical protein
LLVVVLLCGCSPTPQAWHIDKSPSREEFYQDERPEDVLDSLSAADVDGTRMSILSITRTKTHLELKVRLVIGRNSKYLGMMSHTRLAVQFYDANGEQVGMWNDYRAFLPEPERLPGLRLAYTCHLEHVEELAGATQVAFGHPHHYTKPVAIPGPPVPRHRPKDAQLPAAFPP